MKQAFAVIALILISNILAFAQDTEDSFQAKLAIEAGVEFGGDEILQVFFTSGEDQTIDAGQGGFISAGGQFHLPSVPVYLATTLGVKYTTTAASNANIRFLRFPLNVMGYYKFMDGFRVGAGGNTHLGVNLKGDGFVPDTDYTSNFGPRFEIGYKWIAATYSILEFTDESDNKYSASSFGVLLSFTIPSD